MHVVIFSGGTVRKSPLITSVLERADLFIAADSGAKIALHFGITPHAVVGDMDSIDKKTKQFLQKKHVLFTPGETTLVSLPQGHRKPLNVSEKDQTDTELAVNYAIKNGATEITVLGGNDGDRFDHVLANIFLAVKLHVPTFFINGNQLLWIAKGPSTVVINGNRNDLLSLIPINGDVSGITTEHLYYPLANAALLFGKPRGISNVLLKKRAKVKFVKGLLLFVHTVGES